jgi:phosphoribosyl 1,2-cyclic phosphodiesterase
MKYQLVFNVKFDDLVNESIKVHVDIVDGKKVLIVEGKKIHQGKSLGLRSLKDVRRVVPLPDIFDVDKIVFHVLSNGVLNVKLPIVTMKKTQWIGCFDGMKKLEKKNFEKYDKCDYYNW